MSDFDTIQPGDRVRACLNPAWGGTDVVEVEVLSADPATGEIRVQLPDHQEPSVFDAAGREIPEGLTMLDGPVLILS